MKADVENTGRAKDQSEVFSFSIDDSLQKLQAHSSEPRHGKPRRGRRNFPPRPKANISRLESMPLEVGLVFPTPCLCSPAAGPGPTREAALLPADSPER